MKKLSNVNFGMNEILQRNQMKNIIGGDYPNGFDFGPLEYACDDANPTNDTGFIQCMFWQGCL